MFREDKNQTNEINYNIFKTIYKRLGIKTNINDEKDIFKMLSFGSSREGFLNLRMLNKLAEVLAKQLFKNK